MGSKLYVGNLSWGTNTDELHKLFSEYGTITDAIVLEDRDTGRSRGFGFVTFESDDQARAAMEALDGADIDGRNIKVNEAQERSSGGGRGGRGGGGGGGGRGGRGGGGRW